MNSEVNYLVPGKIGRIILVNLLLYVYTAPISCALGALQKP